MSLLEICLLCICCIVFLLLVASCVINLTVETSVKVTIGRKAHENKRKGKRV